MLDTDLRQMKREQARLEKELEFRRAEREANPVTDPDDPSKKATPLPDEEEKKKKTLDQVDRPKLAATTVLDNFIGMQYEIIAKQLTLLRDEVGPEYRIIFLELPALIYTAASKGDDYIAQVQ
jgi:hypothetical protein